MKRTLFACLLACMSILWGCGEKGTDPETPADGTEYLCEGPFKIEVSDLMASTLKVTFKPEDASGTYYCSVVTSAFLETFDVDGDIQETIANVKKRDDRHLLSSVIDTENVLHYLSAVFTDDESAEPSYCFYLCFIASMVTFLNTSM